MKGKDQLFSWKQFKSKIFPGILIGIPATFLLLFVVQRLVYFPTIGIGSSPERLGLYGDYFGGIVGGITSVATLGVTIYLALLLHRLEKENTKSAIETQTRVAVMQMKFQELTKYREKCDYGLELIGVSPETVDRTREGCRIMEKCIIRLLMVFPELEEIISIEMEALITALNNIARITYSIRMASGGVHVDEFEAVSLTQTLDNLTIASDSYFIILGKLGKWAKE